MSFVKGWEFLEQATLTSFLISSCKVDSNIYW